MAMKRRLKSAFLSIGLLFLLDPAGRANAALPRSAVWLSPFTYQTSQADAMAGNLAPITVSGTVNLSLQVTCNSLHFNLTAAAGCADSITSDHSCPAGQPTDLVSYPVGTNLFTNFAPQTYVIPINTAQLQNGLHDVGCSIIDAASGAFDGVCPNSTGGDGDVVLNVQNGSSCTSGGLLGHATAQYRKEILFFRAAIRSATAR
jgi:hypothetical protein